MRYLHKNHKRLYLLVESEEEGQEAFRYLQKAYSGVQLVGLAKVSAEGQRDCSTLEGLLRGVRRRKVQHFCKGLQTERQAICTAEGEPRHINVSDSDTGKETA